MPNLNENRYKKRFVIHVYRIYSCLCKIVNRLQNSHCYHPIFHACSIPASLSTLPSTDDQPLYLIEKSDIIKHMLSFPSHHKTLNSPVPIPNHLYCQIFPLLLWMQYCSSNQICRVCPEIHLLKK